MIIVASISAFFLYGPSSIVGSGPNQDDVQINDGDVEPTPEEGVAPLADNSTFVSANLGEGIILALQIDKTSYKPGENVSMRWILFNNGSKDVEVVTEGLSALTS